MHKECPCAGPQNPRQRTTDQDGEPEGACEERQTELTDTNFFQGSPNFQPGSHNIPGKELSSVVKIGQWTCHPFYMNKIALMCII